MTLKQSYFSPLAGDCFSTAWPETGRWIRWRKSQDTNTERDLLLLSSFFLLLLLLLFLLFFFFSFSFFFSPPPPPPSLLFSVELGREPRPSPC
jgi:hypothetical protein